MTAHDCTGGMFGCWSRTGLDIEPASLTDPAPCYVCGRVTDAAVHVHSEDTEPVVDHVFPLCHRECDARFLGDLLAVWPAVPRKTRKPNRKRKTSPGAR